MATWNSSSEIFIGSSSEGKEVAEYLQLALGGYGFEVTLWSQGVFGLARGTLDELIKASKKSDYAVLVLTPDDTITKRGVTRQTARDNVLFEMGLFMGSLGQDRIFVVHSVDDNVEIPSDLAGFTTAKFKRRKDRDLLRAVAPAALLIRDAITRVQAESEGEPLADLVKSFEADDQRNIIRPVLESLREAFEWSKTFQDKEMFDTVRNQILGDLRRIGRRRLSFRPPKLWDQWVRLLRSLNPETDEIRLVSDNDIEYWVESISEEETEAKNYALALKEFRGSKSRILVVDRRTIIEPPLENDIVNVITRMVSDGFRIVIVIKEDIQHPPNPFPNIWTDFGMIGTLAVSFFDEDQDDDFSRSLIESFDDYDKQKAVKNWDSLMALKRWDSSGAVDQLEKRLRRWCRAYRANQSNKARSRKRRRSQQ